MSASNLLQRLIRNRVARIVLAFLLITIGAWMYVPHLRYRIASSAFVNAELLRFTAPIAGRLTRGLPRKGDFIENPVKVTLIEAISWDERHVVELEGQLAASKERADLARKQLKELLASDEELESRTQLFRRGMIARLGHERAESQAEKTGCSAEVQQRQNVSTRFEQMVKSGLASQIRSAEALATQDLSTTRCEMAHARLQRLETEITSAQSGVFLRDGSNDVPYAQQQRDRLLLRRQELEAKLLEETLLLARADREIKEERERLSRLRHFDLLLPAGHVVWSVAASPGSTVSEGQVVLDLAACEERFVVVELPERDFEQVKADAPALVRLIGSDEWTQGQVRQVRGSAARADDRLLAAQVPRPNLNSISVEIGLPAYSAPPDRNSFCHIGRLAEVRFERSGLAFVDRIEKKLREFTGYVLRIASN